MQSSNKTIAKNTVFLYFRMMFTMVVALFTSRVILDKLGVDDYGIYQAVGGIVGFLSFINGALSTGSSRFLTFALGEGNKEKLKKTFSTTLTIHIGLALLIALVAETVGLWFLCNKMVIAPERMDAAVWVFHLSIVTAMFTLTQVPYNASIISHERMSVYAYTSIVEVSLKLIICYMLTIGGFDRLKLYAALLCLVQVGMMSFYRFYCNHHFSETHYSPRLYDKGTLREIAGFSGWSLFAGGSLALNGQGILILLNMFFSPAVVSARAISLQVNMAANQFVSNFRTAANPQIVKRFAAKDYEGSKRLLLSSTKYSYYMMWLLSLPICLLAAPLLSAWLKEVPEYTVVFLQLIVIQSLFQVFDTSFYMALYAKGQLRENALISPTLGFIQFPIIYVLFRMGCSPLALSWANMILYAILGFVVKPILIIRIVNYTWRDVFSVFRPCLWVTLLSLPLPLLAVYVFDIFTILGFITVSLVCIVSIAVAVWTVGIDGETRGKVGKVVRSKVAEN